LPVYCQASQKCCSYLTYIWPCPSFNLADWIMRTNSMNCSRSCDPAHTFWGRCLHVVERGMLSTFAIYVDEVLNNGSPLRFSASWAESDSDSTDPALGRCCFRLAECACLSSPFSDTTSLVLCRFRGWSCWIFGR
jgi:hypothetical protein